MRILLGTCPRERAFIGIEKKPLSDGRGSQPLSRVLNANRHHQYVRRHTSMWQRCSLRALRPMITGTTRPGRWHADSTADDV